MWCSQNFAMTVVSHGPGPCMVIPNVTYPVGDGKFNLQAIVSLPELFVE